jgi:hypothetical protein
MNELRLYYNARSASHQEQDVVYLKWYIDVYMYYVDVQLYSFLMLAQNGVGGCLHALATFSQGKVPPVSTE